MLISKIQAEITKHDKPENRANYQQFFKEKLKEPYGLKVPILRKIANETFKEVKGRQAKEILDICDKLLASGERYMQVIAFIWALKVKGDYRKTDFARFERWLKNYVNNWGNCDHFCGISGELLVLYPDLVAKTKKWAKSKNRWFRRAAAVSLIEPVRKRLMLDEVFKYVMKNKARMPRTALRYAIEKYPQAKRKKAMAK